MTPEQKIVGNCLKHPGQNFVNCPLCEIEEQKTRITKGYHAVEYAGYWKIQSSPFYGDKDLLDAEDVGIEQAEKNANLIVDLLNSNTQIPDGEIKTPEDLAREIVNHPNLWGMYSIVDAIHKLIAGRSVGLEREKENAIGFAHWKDRHFKRTYPWTGYFYCLENYKSVKLIPGVLYGEHYSFEQLYDMYIISQK